jgi:hypothetical protein
VKYPVVYNQRDISGAGAEAVAAGAHRPRSLPDADATDDHGADAASLAYYDDSYGVNSENNGPYGDAIMRS